jgi:hypothetical protein
MAENGVLYMRRSLKDNDRVLEWSPAAAKSPDIIPYGAGTTGDAQKLFKENYSQDVGRPLIPGEPNHVYVRAKNLGGSPAAGAVRLYQTKSSLLLFPQMWQDGPLKTASGGDTSALRVTEPGAVVVGAEPFVWNPDVPPSRFHYCLVALATTDGTPPPAAPKVRDVRGLAQWLADAKLTSRNVFFVDANAPAAAVDTEYEQGETEAKIDFTIECTNCPVGKSWVQFMSSSKPPIQIGKTKITDSNFVTGVSNVVVPANLKTTFQILYWAEDQPGAGWQIDFVASMKVPKSDPLFAHARTPAEMGWPRADHLAEGGGTPVKSVTLGTATLKNASIL